MSAKKLISIIIPTTATPQRASLLSRALWSLERNQVGLLVPIVVANGSRCSPEFVESLKRRHDVRFRYLEEGNAVAARLAGRKMVDTEFFGMLDDDDEYLPGAIEARLEPLLNDNSTTAVITNGYRAIESRDQILFDEFSTFSSDPLGKLMDHPWLTSAGGLYRTEHVGLEYFNVPRYMEMTYMGIMLALTRKLCFLDVPTFRLHSNSPESVSGSEDYLRGAAEALCCYMALDVPKRIRRRLTQKYTESLHTISDFERSRGNYRAAWRYHLKSLFSSNGMRHLFYTRHLIRITRPSVDVDIRGAQCGNIDGDCHGQ